MGSMAYFHWLSLCQCTLDLCLENWPDQVWVHAANVSVYDRTLELFKLASNRPVDGGFLSAGLAESRCNGGRFEEWA